MGVTLIVVRASFAVRGDEQDDLRARVEAAAARFPELSCIVETALW
jgi:hypothetical protein